MRLRALSVTELNKYLKKIINSDPILNNVMVKGEVSNIKYHDSGNIYFSLKDESSKINCVMFKENAVNIKFFITNGMSLLIKGYVSTFEKDSQYQIYVKTMEPEGLGALFLSFNQLKDKLQAEGLFSKENKKKIPYFPNKIAIVTSPTGAALKDILSVIKRRNKKVDILIVPVLVQGESAPQQICNAIERINSLDKKVDLIILSRGGGSIEELWAFNEEVVARSIYKSNIPIISAIGHESDFTISDYVADLRAATPSAAAEIAVPDQLELSHKLLQLKARLDNSMVFVLKSKQNKLSILDIDRISSIVQSRIKEERHHLDQMYDKLRSIQLLYFERSRTKLYQIGGKLELVNPFSTLSRGYALALNNDNDVITTINKACKDDHINIMLTDGTINCLVLEVTKEENRIE